MVRVILRSSEIDNTIFSGIDYSYGYYANNYPDCRIIDGSNYSCCGRFLFQKPFLGTANTKYRNCFGICSFLLEIFEASIKTKSTRFERKNFE